MCRVDIHRGGKKRFLFHLSAEMSAVKGGIGLAVSASSRYKDDFFYMWQVL